MIIIFGIPLPFFNIVKPQILVGERSNFKNFPTHTQDHGDAQQRGGECCLRTNADRLRRRSPNVEEVDVRLLPDPTEPSTVTPAPPSS